MRRHHIVIPLAALLAIAPLLRYGTSCGHDIGFHMQSWVDAAAQLRHGTLYPRWAFTPAWQAGEPRFTFYPPLSWMFGALLTLLLPMPATPNVFLFVVLVAAGFSMYAVARRFTSPDAALLAACVYLANPYMFFNAFERSAFAEMLASVWIPLLFLAVLRRRPSTAMGACALALAWLTNVPAGIMATYTFVVLAVIRVALDWRAERHRQMAVACSAAASPGTLHTSVNHCLSAPEDELHSVPLSSREHAIRLVSGLVLGLALPGFYLLPAVLERRFVQASSVMAENLRYQDNFLFERTAWEPHNIVLHAASVCATFVLIGTACVLAGLFLSARRRDPAPEPDPELDPKLRRVCIAFAVLFGLVLFLLLPVSGFLWHLAPELPYLQFPWRLLTILSAVLALALACALRTWKARAWVAPALALLYVGIAMDITSSHYRQACEIPHMAQFTVDMFQASHGVPATDEYTPGDADNDLLRTDSPGYWLAPMRNPDAYAAGTKPNPNEVDPMFDGPIPAGDTVAEHAPTHLDLNLREPAVLVLNLREYPEWRVTRNGAPAPKHVRRDDGLTAIPLPAGPSRIDVRWHRGADVYAGDAVSLAAVAALGMARRRSRRIESNAA